MESCKSFFRALRPALIITLILLVLCGLIYPLVMTGVSQLLFPSQANGSMLTVNGSPVGSRFVGQQFTEDYFMKGRPSAVNYNTYTVNENGEEVYLDGTPYNGLASGSANYGPSNPALRERVEQDMEAFLAANPDITRDQIPTDLMTASGSGLDPHISPESAKVQLPAISAASGLSMDTLEQIVEDATTGKLFGIFGGEAVNVLEVNIAIAQAMYIVE